MYSPNHQMVLEAIYQLRQKGEPVDALSVSNELSAPALKRVGGLDWLASCADKIPTIANIAYYEKIVRDHASSRALLEVTYKIQDDIFDEGGVGVDEQFDRAERYIGEAGRDRGVSEVSSSIEIHESFFSGLEDFLANGQTIKGLSTGIDKLDEMTSGLQPGDLIILGGRPSMGKTAMALSWGLHSLRNDDGVFIISREMKKDSLYGRLVSMNGKIPGEFAKNRNIAARHADKILLSSQELVNMPLFIDDRSRYLWEVRNNARQVANKKGLKLIIVDYLQLMWGDKDKSRERQIAEISMGLKDLAGELNVPVVALSQLNRKVEERPDKRPMMSDLRESGQIEQDADLVVFMYRDEYYNEETFDKGIAEAIVGKQRGGRVGTVRMRWRAEYTLFENLW